VKRQNTIEHEIDEIRVAIYNKTKGLSIEQFNDYFRKRMDEIARTHRFKRIADANSVLTPNA